jgi:hypothetical protein
MKLLQSSPLPLGYGARYHGIALRPAAAAPDFASGAFERSRVKDTFRFSFCPNLAQVHPRDGRRPIPFCGLGIRPGGTATELNIQKTGCCVQRVHTVPLAGKGTPEFGARSHVESKSHHPQSSVATTTVERVTKIPNPMSSEAQTAVERATEIGLLAKSRERTEHRRTVCTPSTARDRDDARRPRS